MAIRGLHQQPRAGVASLRTIKNSHLIVTEADTLQNRVGGLEREAKRLVQGTDWTRTFRYSMKGVSIDVTFPSPRQSVRLVTLHDDPVSIDLENSFRWPSDFAREALATRQPLRIHIREIPVPSTRRSVPSSPRTFRRSQSELLRFHRDLLSPAYRRQARGCDCPLGRVDVLIAAFHLLRRVGVGPPCGRKPKRPRTGPSCQA